VHVAGNGASPDPDALGCGELAQLHGDVDPHFVAALGRPVIRAIAFDADDIERWDGAAGVRALLVDGPDSGSGRGFDHVPLATMRDRIRLPLLLAGGLTADNVGDAIRAVRPYAVDVSSGVETAPGEKCPALIRAFCAAVQAADA
jgi:phosphoribosylanthranilate isomerase